MSLTRYKIGPYDTLVEGSRWEVLSEEARLNLLDNGYDDTRYFTLVRICHERPYRGEGRVISDGTYLYTEKWLKDNCRRVG